MKKAIPVFATISVLMFSAFFSSAQNFSSSPDFFPIAVFSQAPYNIQSYKNIGVNIYYDLSWGALDAYHLNALHNANMYVMCAQDSFALTMLNDTLIYGWTMVDEPDNAQWNSITNQYDSCINPIAIIGRYNANKAVDSTRPVALNLGQGVANNTWIGRGACYNWNASYPTYNNGYLSGCDIGSFDIYPVNSTILGITDSLWYVAKGMDSLYAWSPNTQKPMWAWIETTKISSESAGKPTPAQVKSEVWMVLIHGAKGIGYFTHSWDPTYISGAVLLDTAMVAAMKAINLQISALAPVLNSPDIIGYSTVSSSNATVPIDIMTKNRGGYNYIFSVAMRNGNTSGTFSVASGTNAEVLGENRTIPIIGGQFSDSFSSYGTHLYKIQAPSSVSSDINSEAALSIKVYPNPTASLINIEFPFLEKSAFTFCLYNLLGEKVFEKILPKNTPKYILDMTDISIVSGVYIITLQSESHKLNKKIMFIERN